MTITPYDAELLAYMAAAPDGRDQMDVVLNTRQVELSRLRWGRRCGDRWHASVSSAEPRRPTQTS
jgi:hypothetical protein